MSRDPGKQKASRPARGRTRRPRETRSDGLPGTRPSEAPTTGRTADDTQQATDAVGGVDRRAATAAAGHSNPPLLTGGLLHPFSRGIDWLTMTMSTAIAERLFAETGAFDAGN